MSVENSAHTLLPEFFKECEFLGTNFAASGDAASPDDIFSILEALDGVSPEFNALAPPDDGNWGRKEGGGEVEGIAGRLVACEKLSTFTFSAAPLEVEVEVVEAASSPKSKRQKVGASGNEAILDGQQQKISHITVERNRRKQMNENLSVLRSLMPGFYVKRGDQASIVGGVVDYISELQQVLQSLEAKKQRKIYSEAIMSPRLISSPRNLPISPRKPPPSPRLLPSLPISPRTPQPSSPYKQHRLHQPGYLSPTMAAGPSFEPSPSNSLTCSATDNSMAIANSKSNVADVEVKFSGPNVLLKTTSAKIPGQAVKIIAALEDLSLEILNVSLSTTDETVVNSFTIKIGIECQLSAEELANHIQQTFCQV